MSVSIDPGEPTPAQRLLGGFAPELVALNDDVLFGRVWVRPGLSARDRSMITVASLVSAGNIEQLRFHLPFARQNGVTVDELVEMITHLAFYASWPKAMSAMTLAKELLGDDVAAGA